MPLSWNEIKDRAIRFSRDWAGETREHAEAKSFWDAFFTVFGLKRRNVASFEAPVKKLSGDWGFIDLFWKGQLLVEHKSLGKSLDKAHAQGIDYIQALVADGRQDECPRYLLVSDFARFALHDLDEGTHIEFPLAQLYHHVHAFAFIAGYQTHTFVPDDPANLKAAAIMGDLHDALAAAGYTGHALERFLVRVLFCFFAEDNGLCEPNAISGWIETHTAVDGSDLGLHLHRIFSVLNTPEGHRQPNLPEELDALPYVNGGLFEESLPLAECTREMRAAFLACANFRWNQISPAVFGSLFQTVLEPAARRQIGAHYTSERDILKVVRSLFLDDLRAELDAAIADRSTRRDARLDALHDRLAALRFLDPACGCGNFLVIAYRELRRLEIDLLRALHTSAEGLKQGQLDVNALSRVDVDQFYGIEIEEWPARIAEVALWLMDHQMNQQLSGAFGQYYVRLPLRKSATIVHGNALRLDWKTILPPDQCSYILGNPPFVGKQFQDGEQRADMFLIWDSWKGVGVLDYVTAWYAKAAQYMQKTLIRAGLVSTNSISQGEQAGSLWNHLFQRYGLKIHFAHRTFPWESEARGKAHVHVVIVGFAAYDRDEKRIYDYSAKETTVSVVRNIAPYLVEGGDIAILPRQRALCKVPPIVFGSMPNDGGHLLLSRAGKDRLEAAEPGVGRFVRPFMGAQEFINGIERYCLWLKGASPAELRRMPHLLKLVEAVQAYRLASKRETTRKLASTPTLFGEIRQPATRYLLIPSVSSEHRPYIPIGFLPPETIASNLALLVPGATLYHFGVLTSAMHMAWMRQVCGRLKSDYRYSNKLVYNNFPWPEPSDVQQAAIERGAQAVLDARAKYPTSTLADLYDPLTMPPELVKAHADLDRAVDRAYRKEPFAADRERVEHLFQLYEQLTAPLVATEKPKRRRKGV